MGELLDTGNARAINAATKSNDNPRRWRATRRVYQPCKRQSAQSPQVSRHGAAASRFQHQFRIKLSIHMLHSTSACSSGILVGKTPPFFVVASKLINSMNRVTPRCAKCANSIYYLGGGPNSQLKTNATFMAATLDPQPLETTQNTTAQAARTIWQFAQVWFQEFPKYNTTNNEISIWGTSYGGFWSTGFMSHFITQNKLIVTHQHKNENATVLPIVILGIANGCIDTRVEALGYPHLAYNDTYGIQVYNESVYNEVMQQAVAPKAGCYDAVDACRALANEDDPYGYGNNQTVNQACLFATEACFEKVVAPYFVVSNVSSFDITYLNITSDATDYFNGLFNQRWTCNVMVQDISLLEHVLKNGVGVTLMFGDRDYKCNWIGAENISLSVDYPATASFRQAGYTDIENNSSYKGGFVRQHGNISFSRVFDAGHAVAAYQPQTVYEIFKRSMFRKDIATGAQDVNDGFSTKGPLNSWATKNSVPSNSPENVCYTYVAADTCTIEQLNALANGTTVIVDFVVTTPAGKRLDNSPGGAGDKHDGS
ncbi:hypothetical protein MKX08_005246 [Trichoderma sp. CBMAI-0020]|nr:hypothetical protein MKX08_005246 [Trichoderma sp. CBMAI-0020]